MTNDPLRDGLRSHGYRMTPQRRLVLEAVVRLGHATPDEVHAEVAAAGINLSTVYRNLELLEQLGFVSHTHLGQGATTYHASDDDHVHLVCRGCGEVADAPPAVLRQAVGTLARDHAFEVDVRHIALFGRCAGCSDQA